MTPAGVEAATARLKLRWWLDGASIAVGRIVRSASPYCDDCSAKVGPRSWIRSTELTNMPIQAVQALGTSVDTLAGVYRVAGPQPVRPVAARRATGSWSVRAG
jgi:hypothetical protein